MRQTILILLVIIISFPAITYGQKGKKITITGKVVDASDKPVSGASIFIDKEKTDVVTDKDGFYKIKVRTDAGDILVFSLLSGAMEEQIGGRTEINFVLVNKAGGNTNPPVTGDKTASDKGKKEGGVNVKNSPVPVYRDIYDMIKGRVPGVEVSGKSIKIRGTSSLNVSTEPLFVVDGVIVKDIDYIAPETVKSIEVLKGPDATSYGSRGSNGVIVITSKTGKD